MPQPEEKSTCQANDISDKPKVVLGKSSQNDLRREAKTLLAEAKKENSTWNKLFFK